MTTVTFYSEGSRLTGLEMKGHSGYAPQGEDIVCAALDRKSTRLNSSHS